MSTLSKLLEGKYLYHPDGYVYSTKRTNLDRVANNQMPLVIKSKNASGVYGAQIGTKFYPLAQIVYTLVHGPLPANSIVIVNHKSDIPYQVKAEWLTVNTQQPKDPLTATEADILDMLHSLYKIVDGDVYRSRTLASGEQSLHPIKGLNGGSEPSVRIGATLVTKTILHKILTTNSLGHLFNDDTQEGIANCIKMLRSRAKPYETDDGTVYEVSGTDYLVDELVDFLLKTGNVDLVTNAVQEYKKLDSTQQDLAKLNSLNAINDRILEAREELSQYLEGRAAIATLNAQVHIKLRRLAVALIALTRST